MTERVGQFEKISIEQWRKDFGDNNNHTYDYLLDDIPMPKRATVGSAGYDICTPYDVDLEPGEEANIPTGLKCKINNGWALFALPKSGLGFKYYTRLANTIGLIDEDYYNNENNEGHMWVKIRNEGSKPLHIDCGKGMCQMVFLPYGITYDDEAEGIREGGFGSTNS